MTTPDQLQTKQVLDTLLDVLHGSESDTARIAAAKILLDRLAPDENDEEQKQQAEERDGALAEAYGLLTEIATLKLTVLRQTRELAAAGASATNNPAR